ncbi:MAG: WG repeat-containing protein, partial [Saprospiraceae bacterium]|nr:WG repeat-containing protein [Saprospiraceae bacterium]
MGCAQQIIRTRRSLARAGDFGFIRVKQYDKWGFLDCKGKNVIPIEFDTISPFTESTAFAIY